MYIHIRENFVGCSPCETTDGEVLKLQQDVKSQDLKEIQGNSAVYTLCIACISLYLKEVLTLTPI